jgi:hypothetical protein
MKKLQWSGSILSLCVTLGCVGPFPDEGDDEAGDDGSASSPETGGSEVSGWITMTGPFDTDGGGHTSVGSSDSMATTDPGPGESATSVSGTATCAECSTTSDTGDTEGHQEVCGIEIEHDPSWNNQYICGCEACEVSFSDIVPSNGEELLAECECICYELGCGGSVSGGVTSDSEGSGGWEDSGDTFDTTSGTTDPTDASASEPTTASSEDSGAGSDDTDPTG